MRLAITPVRPALCALVLLCLPALAAAQSNELFIPAPTTATDYLNVRINGDTLANGQRAHPNRVYVLQRGGTYFMNGFVRNTGYALNIKAQDGTGPRPVIYLVKNTTTNAAPGNLFDVRGNLSLRSVALVGYLEPVAADIANMPGQIIGTGAAGFDIVLDDVVISNSTGNHIRTDQAARVIKVTNSLFVNMGDLRKSNLGAGKAIDVRGVSCDTLLVRNSTFVNFQDRVIRHRSSTAPINVLIFDHNTLVNGMSYHGMLALGQVGRRVQITNNLFVDAFALGDDPSDATRQAEFEESGEKNADGTNRMSWVISVPNTTTQWIVRNNYYAVSTAGQAWFNKYTSAGVRGEGPPLTRHQMQRLGADSTNAFRKVALTLNNAPALMTAMMDWYRTPEPAGAGRTKTTTAFSAQFDYDRKPITYFTGASAQFNAGFGTSGAAYTGATGNCPAGDLTWYPALKVACTAAAASVAREGEARAATAGFTGIAPNPTAGETRIGYTLRVPGAVALSVHDVLGREVTRLVVGMQAAGAHEAWWDGTSGAAPAAAGVYVVRLVAGGAVQTRTVILAR
ncbi:MAG TPA: FlgD immunoglobulin-like domain containing protein [Rhodothermales bacterium]|nr:FlgD immunoglobulin-like domain containing protein [Rhodothermales bacterium]